MQSTIPVHSLHADTADAKNLALGVFVGLLAACIGALYIVYARWGITHGLSSPDLTALRFGVAGFATMPLLLHAMVERRAILIEKWRIWLAISLLAGTPFGLGSAYCCESTASIHGWQRPSSPFRRL